MPTNAEGRTDVELPDEGRIASQRLRRDGIGSGVAEESVGNED